MQQECVKSEGTVSGRMYGPRPAKDAVLALMVYAAECVCLYIEGRYSDSQVIYWTLGQAPTVLAVVLTLLRDHRLKNLGFYPGHLKKDAFLLFLMVVAQILAGVYGRQMEWGTALRRFTYYFLWIALGEELLFRGFIQSFLFGLRMPRWAIYVLGAALFSLSHIPYQMQIRPWDWLFTVQLCMTFALHLLFCFFTNKRGNMLLAWGIHTALDFLEI